MVVKNSYCCHGVREKVGSVATVSTCPIERLPPIAYHLGRHLGRSCKHPLIKPLYYNKKWWWKRRALSFMNKHGEIRARDYPDEKLSSLSTRLVGEHCAYLHKHKVH